MDLDGLKFYDDSIRLFNLYIDYLNYDLDKLFI